MIRRHIITMALLLLAVAGHVKTAYAQGPMTNGLSHTAVISVPGEVDEWTFTATAGATLILKIGTEFSPYLALYAPDGSFIDQRLGNGGDREAVLGVVAPQSGSYRVVVSSRFGTAGNYTLTFAEIPGSPQVSPGDQGGVMTNGLTHTGALYTGDMDQWQFTAPAGATVIVRIGSEFSPYLGLYGPDGALVTQAGANVGSGQTGLGTTTTQAGTYTVLVSNSFAGTGNYSLTLALIPGTPQVSPDDQGGPMTNGLTHPGALYGGDMDQWTFTAPAAASVLVRIGGAFSPYLAIYGPTGTLLQERGANGGSAETGLGITTTQAGTYTVIVGSSFAGTGNYSLTLALVPGTPQVSPGDQGGPMANGLTYAGALYTGDMDQWTFTATAGAALNVRVGGQFAPYLALYGPGGALLTERASSVGSAETGLSVALAPQAGVYTVVVANAFLGGTGNYQLTTAVIPGTPQVSPGDQGGQMTNGVNYPGAIYTGDMDQWTFRANAGASLNVRMTADFSPYVALYGPDGALVGERGASVSGTEAEVAVSAPQTGVYTAVVLNSFLGGAGAYQIRVTGAASLSDLQLTKTASVASVARGGPLTFTLTVANLGPEAATAVVVTDAVPATLTIVSCTASGGIPCIVSGNTRTVTFPALAINGSATVTIATTVQDSAGSTVVNTAAVAGNVHDGVVGNNASSVTVAVTRAPTPEDTDGDGLPDAWETDFGLNPNSASGDDGESGDPDLDGLTNTQELANGTHPRGFFVSYLAEGARNAFFEARLAVLNVGSAPGRLLFRFLQAGGVVTRHVVALPQLRRITIGNDVLNALASPDFSTMLESDQPIVLDRTMSWNNGAGSHAETGVPLPASTWYLAEGSTSGEFSLFYLLQNPNPIATVATVRYLLPFGQTPIVRTYDLAANSRTTIPVDEQGASLATTDVSAVITTPNNAPIIVERAMYRSTPTTPFAAGHGSAGVTAPAMRWFLAEGATGPYFDCFILLANPNTQPANVTIDYLLSDGRTFTKAYSVPAESRYTVWVDTEEIPEASGVRPLGNVAVSSTVTSNVAIIVERTMWWPGPELGPNYWTEAHNSPGATATGTLWALAEGEVGGSQAAETYILIANTSPTPGTARVTLYFADGSSAALDVALLPRSRSNVNVSADFPNRPTTTFSAVVESLPTGGNPAPQIVVERAMYTSPGGATWEAGTNALASRQR